MSEITIVDMAQSLARHASIRQGLVTQNIANADTPGYRAQDVRSFAELYRAPGGESPRGVFVPAASRPGHPDEASQRGGDGLEELEAFELTQLGAAQPNGNTVSIEDQMARSAEVKLSHDMALTIMRKAMDLMRASLGRGR
ncbi:MAG: FlgB family protein [Pseudomonadota bacterium]